MSSQYIVDKNYRLKKAKTSVWAVIRKILMFLIVTASLAILYYLVFALFFSTETERRLKYENRMYSTELPQMMEKERMVSDVIQGLVVKDDRIYEEIFHTSSPGIDPIYSVDFLHGLDSIPDMDIVLYSESKIDRMEGKAASVEDNFRKIAALLSSEGYEMPPMHNPLEDFSVAQTGASTGSKINPFYKVEMYHNGLDLIAHSGEPVYAASEGTVKEVIRSRKGLGNQVVIDHGNGYVTKYAHLADVEAVKGRKVKRGTRLGYVGVSGNSFAPHLHYEVWKDTVALDPVNHLFASVSPDEYVNMLVMSSATGQSMD
ncbi:MAG: M23 family metallopeptidase [Bacteroidales bacterium]|nr:M23 family metallopeptidase [Bacteroidales bacterium]